MIFALPLLATLMALWQLPPTQRTIVGVARSYYGQPEAGAAVYLVHSPLNGLTDNSFVVATTQCDQDGQFRFEQVTDEDLERCDLFILGKNQTVAEASPLQGPGVLDVRLSRPMNAKVLVLGPDDKPLPGERIFPEFGWPFPREVRQSLSQVTDANGTCTLPKFYEGPWVACSVDDARYFEAYDGWPVIGRSEPRLDVDRVIKLHKFNTIYGRVVDRDSQRPLSGIPVRVDRHANGAPQIYRAVTDALGIYRVSHLTEGQYEVSANILGPYGTVKLLQGENQEIADLELGTLGELDVEVVWMDNGRACPNQSVWLADESPRERSFDTDARGKVKISLASGDYRLSIGAEATVDVQVEENKTTKAKFRVKRTQVVSSDTWHEIPQVDLIYGRVVDGKGDAVANAEVIAIGPFIERELTDEEGRFTFGQFSLPFNIRASKGDWMTETAVIKSAKGAANITPKLVSKAFWVSGTVCGSDGEPAPSAQIEVLDLEKRFGDYAIATGLAGADGTFKISGLWPDLKYVVKVFDRGVGAWRSSPMRGRDYVGGIELGTIKLARPASAAIPVGG
jgi:hypothetical protein